MPVWRSSSLSLTFLLFMFRGQGGHVRLACVLCRLGPAAFVGCFCVVLHCIALSLLVGWLVGLVVIFFLLQIIFLETFFFCLAWYVFCGVTFRGCFFCFPPLHPLPPPPRILFVLPCTASHTVTKSKSSQVGVSLPAELASASVVCHD